MLRRKPTVVALACVAALAVLGLLHRPAPAEIRVPTDDKEILQRLTLRADPASAALRARLRAQPNDLAAAVALARTEIERARARSDPRALGYAQAALAPWWDRQDAPLDVLVLRATIRQSQHDFPDALSDLDRALRLDPSHAQALVTKATIHIVRGEYTDARATCVRLAPHASRLVGEVCSCSVRSVTGDAAGALATLEQAAAGDASPAERAWATSTLGEIALRAGDPGKALRFFEASLASDPDDAYALGAWADAQLDAGRAGEVIDRLRARTEVDALLLRLAIAERVIHAPDAASHAAELRARFDAARARGDSVHLREEARFALRVEDDPARAVDLAAKNFAIQRESWDVRILLESAEAARRPEAAAPVLAWIDASGFSDISLAPAIARARKAAR